MSHHKFALGTAQFGMDYGFESKTRQIPADDVPGVLETAFASGIDTLDTAVAYGNSELRLGEAGVSSWKVISKIPVEYEGVLVRPESIGMLVLGSLERLRVPQLDGILFHRASQLLSHEGEAMFNELKKLKMEGRIRKVGISLYTPNELMDVVANFDIDIAQVPLNIFDRRFLESGSLAMLKGKGIEIHARSIFLQGQLLRGAQTRPHYFKSWESLWNSWDQWLRDQNVSALGACLAFGLQFEELDRIIVGVKSRLHLENILAATANHRRLTFPDIFSSNDAGLVNPANWRD